MKYNSKKVLGIITTFCLIIAMGGMTFAHSGRTDSNGGHKDNQNKSGLGSYHYHCGGHPAHLHENGVCPYSSNLSGSSSSSSSSSNKSSTSVTTSSPSVTIKEETIVKAESIEINENITNMKVGETQKLTASITPTNTTDKEIVWKSSNEDIVTVSTTGKIVALEAGTVSITASTNNGKTDVIEIIIEEVKEEKEKNNTIVMPIINDEISNKTTNTATNNTEDSNENSGLMGLILLGGVSYWGYKKYKKSKK